MADFKSTFGRDPEYFFSAPGRIEVSGNHTDHQHGCVMAAAINLKTKAWVALSDRPEINMVSRGHGGCKVDLKDLEFREEAKGTSGALVAGIAYQFAKRGAKLQGFDIYVDSEVLPGSGMSSSASFEVMMGNVFNHLFLDDRCTPVEIAQIGQWSENNYYGKPCGLMDQTACAVGGFITIDFCDPSAPVIEKIGFDLTKAGYNLCIVNTGGNHTDLNDDYASIPAEMKSVARELGAEVLRGTTLEALDKALAERGSELREKVGDRAILRAYHFFAENERVDGQVKALKSGDIDGFMNGVVASGNSSFRFLQNVYTTLNVKEQGLSLALCLTEEFLRGTRGVCRVHGGGFAGTIQAFVPTELTEKYATMIDGVFGEGACHILSVRRDGAVKVL